MNDKPRLIFINVIEKYGAGIITEPQRLQNLLKDFFRNEYQKERNCLSDSVIDGIPSTLSDKKDQIPYKILSGQLVQKLVQNRGYEKNLAKWTVDTWAIALKVVKEGDIHSSKENGEFPPPSPKKFPIFIITNPPGARVYFDETFCGVGPLELQITAGSHKIKCISRDYHDFNKTIEINYQKKIQQISINLERKPSCTTGSVFINSSPGKASIFIDKVNLGDTPRNVTLSSGFHEIVIKLKGYQDSKYHVTIHSGNNPDIILNLIPINIPKPPIHKFGELAINSNPASEIYIDSVLRGITPQIVTGLTPGRHQLSLKVYGHQPISKDFIIIDGKREKIFIQFPLKTSPLKTNSTRSTSSTGKIIKWLIVLGIVIFALLYLFGR